MGMWDRSWSLTRMSFDIIRKDSEMIWFPILSGIFSILFSVALIVPTFVLGVMDSVGVNPNVVGPIQAVVCFITYFGLAFIATFFNVCTVYTTRVRLSGGDATFGESIKFSLSRIHLIIGWSLVSATVGLLLHALDNIAQKSGLVGKILLMILRSLLASAWAITTVFVTPAMVYKGLGPIDAIKDSVQTLKQTWGENLVRYYGMGLAGFVCMLPGFLLVIVGFVLLNVSAPLGMIVVGLGFLVILVVSVIFNMANTVYKTALYAWASGATQGQAPQGFDPSVLQGAFNQRM